MQCRGVASCLLGVRGHLSNPALARMLAYFDLQGMPAAQLLLRVALSKYRSQNVLRKALSTLAGLYVEIMELDTLRSART